jgi:hypothetical protein
MIPPPAQRQIARRAGSTLVETKGSLAIYVSQPQFVIKLIEQAAKRHGLTRSAKRSPRIGIRFCASVLLWSRVGPRR